jgi:copper(I)-binding protein
MRLCLLSGVLLALPVIALAQRNDIRVENAWSRAAQQGGTGVVYLTIVDSGAADRLTAVASPVAARAELHQSSSENGVVRMRDMAALPVAEGKTLRLTPNGYHIMLMDLKQPLTAGDAFPIVLTFEKAGPVTATVTVQRLGRSLPIGHDGMSHDTMGGMAMPGRTP